ncbi:MAG: ATPase, partial [Spirochaetaceae bacterium]|nr:ATPase [Spirochaetaceae bacterium]
MGDARAFDGGELSLGIELGSTRIKAVLIDRSFQPVAQGGFEWESRLADGVWTYALDNVWAGLRVAFAALSDEVRRLYGAPLTRVASLGVSAMMHGYLVFDAAGGLLAPFRTWRNTTTGAAAAALTEAFNFNVPLRWSVAHLYQALLDGEAHTEHIAFMTTLAGYVHWQLSGRRVLGIGDASGMFPVDSARGGFDADLLGRFDALVQGLPAAARRGFCSPLADILPEVLLSGEDAGVLTEEGARLLDPSGVFQAGAPLCPPEGDAGTGMVATNSVAARTGNVSAGTSIFAMVVLERPL